MSGVNSIIVCVGVLKHCFLCVQQLILVCCLLAAVEMGGDDGNGVGKKPEQPGW